MSQIHLLFLIEGLWTVPIELNHLEHVVHGDPLFFGSSAGIQFFRASNFGLSMLLQSMFLLHSGKLGLVLESGFTRSKFFLSWC